MYLRELYLPESYNFHFPNINIVCCEAQHPETVLVLWKKTFGIFWNLLKQRPLYIYFLIYLKVHTFSYNCLWQSAEKVREIQMKTPQAISFFSKIAGLNLHLLLKIDAIADVLLRICTILFRKAILQDSYGQLIL